LQGKVALYLSMRGCFIGKVSVVEEQWTFFW